jgi:hypothetical protein
VEESGPIRGKGLSLSKGDLKEPGAERRVVQQLPVTDSTPYVFAPIPEGFSDLIPVLDPLGSFLFFADETLARQLVAKHQVRIVRPKKQNTAKKQQVRALQALGPLDDVPAGLICSQNRYFGIPNQRETDVNPPWVWTQDKMGDTSLHPGRAGRPGRLVDDRRARWSRKVCMAVVLDCAKRAA